MTTAPTAASAGQRLREQLAPTRLEVLDESYQHARPCRRQRHGFWHPFSGAYRFTIVYR